ncbi:MAG: thioredoxin family protein [Ignavibacteria bacterium]|nr:thioredoxin family protein [Ignavibacteria bacterium]
MVYVIILIFGFLTLFFAFQYYLIFRSKKISGQTIDLGKIRPELRNYFDKDKLLIYFYSPNCSACRYQSPIIEKLKRFNYNVLSVDISKDLQLARVFGIMGTPSIALMKGNLVKEFLIGFQDEEKLLKEYQSI